MCLSIPGKIIKVNGKKAVADFAGKKMNVNTDLLNVKKDDYVMVYAGYAMEKVPDKKARIILNEFKGSK